MRPSRFLVASTFALLTLIWGTTWAAIRVGLEAGIPPFTGVAVRFAIAAVVLFAISPLFGVRFGRTAVERRLWLLLAAFSFCGSYGIVYWAEQVVPSGLSAVLFATFPLVVSLLAHGTLPGERLGAGALAGALLGFLGVATIFSEDFSRLGGPGVLRAAAILLLAPLVSAVAYVGTKKWGHGIHPISLSAVPMAITAVVMGLVAVATERGAARAILSPRGLSSLLYLAVFGSAVTFSLYYWLLSVLPATRLALIAYAVPVVAVLFGVVVLREPFTPRLASGSALVVLGVAIASARKGDPRGPATPPPEPESAAEAGA